VLGPIVRLELNRSGGQELIEVELPREHYQQDPFQPGEPVYLKLRNLRVFLQAEEQ
jgi:hypothetical protein